MSGGGYQISLRKALGAIKDRTTVRLAKVDNEFKELDVSIIKATSHDERPAKEKHMQAIFAAISATRPRADVSYCIYALKRRLSKTHNWAVALKTLIVIHRAIREVDPTFQKELLNNETDSLFNLTNFKDDSNRNVYYYWVQPYASYIKKRLEYFTALEYDVQAQCTITRDQDTNKLLQKLIDRILGCEPKGAAAHNVVIQLAFSMVASESVKVYNNLVDKFFEMERVHPIIRFKKSETLAKCLSKASEMCFQAKLLCKFYETCKSIKTGMRNGLIKIEPPPSSFIQVMEEYLEEARWALGYVGNLRSVKRKPNRKLAIEYKKVAEVQESGLPPPGEPVKVEARLAEQPPDFMNLDDPVQEVSGLDQKNDAAMTIVPISDQPASSAATLIDAEWELALMTAPSSNEIVTSASKLAGGLDKLTLDSLYDDAEKRTNQTMSYNPWGHGSMPGSMMPPQTSLDPFYAYPIMAAPTNVQIAIAQQQDFMLQQQQQQVIAMNPQVPPQNSNPFIDLYEPSSHHRAYNAEMSSSSSSSSRLIDLHEREALAEEHTNARVRCRCNVYAKCWTSWTLNNPGRRFIECPNYMDPTRDCMFFNWVDPELPNEWYRSRMYDMYMKVKKVKSEDDELNFYKNAYQKSGIDQQCLQKEVEIHEATKIFYDKILIMLLGVIILIFMVYKL